MDIVVMVNFFSTFLYMRQTNILLEEQIYVCDDMYHKLLHVLKTHLNFFQYDRHLEDNEHIYTRIYII